MLTVWGRTNSINVQKVLWTCGELGIEHRRIDAGGSFGGTHSAEFVMRNPNRLVPVIEDDGFVLWESNVIVRYLASKHGLGSLYPADLRRRFEAERWMDWQATTLWPALRPLFIGHIRTKPQDRDPAALARAQEITADTMALLDGELAQRPYLAGDALTMADIPVGATVYRWYALPIEHRDLPHLAHWYRQLAARTAFRDAVMLPLS